jgi:hypothetical protein
VATGRYGRDALRESGADHVVQDFDDTDDMLERLLA